MNLAKILEMYKNRASSERQMGFAKLAGYFIRLKIGEITRKIYCSNNYGKLDVEEHIRYAEKTVDRSIRKILGRIKFGNCIDITKEKRFENIGVGMVITPAMFGNLIIMTQKKSTVYFHTKERKDMKLDIEFFAIPRISGSVMFEDKIIDEFSIPTLTRYKKSIKINSDWIINDISKVTITSDKCWSANYIDSKLPTFPLGVAVQSMCLN